MSAATFGGRTADVTIAGDGCGRLTNTVGPTDAVTLVCPDGPATTVDVTVADRTVTVAVPAAAPPTGQPEPVVVDPVTVAAGDAVTVDLDTSYRRSLPDDGAQVAIGQASRVRLLGSRRTRALVVGDRAGRDVVTLRACDGNGCQQVPLQVTVEASDGVPGLVTDMSLLTGNHVVAAATASGGTDVTVEAGDGNVRTVCVRDEHPGLGGLADNCLRGRVLAGLIRGAAVQP